MKPAPSVAARALRLAGALALSAGCNDITLHENSPEAEGEVIVGDPAARVEPETLDFGEVRVAEGPASELSRTLEVVVHNDGTGTLLLRDVSLDEDDPAFSVGSVSLPSVPAGGELVLQVTFDPIAEGPATDALRIDTNEPGRSISFVEMAGVGVGGR